MATASVPFVTIDEYLHSAFDPDVDYVDGQLEERNLGEFDHGDLQLELGSILKAHGNLWSIRAVVETRVQVSPTRFRVPDVCVMPLSWRREPIIRQAPMLCLEVLSPEDRLNRMRQRCEDYLLMGVPEVWLFDPQKRAAYRITSSSFTEHSVGVLQLAESPIAIDLAALFAVLDR
jgi:Uma2 family endonuclease